MLTFAAVLPAIKPGWAAETLDGMDDTLRDVCLVVDNSPAGQPYPTRAGLVVRGDPTLGVPRSWNTGLAWSTARDADWLIILSEAVRFGKPGGLDFLAHLRDAVDPIVHSQHGWHLIAIHRTVFERVGLFDPIFSPAYYEDSDLLARMHLAGLPSPQYNAGTFCQVVVDAADMGFGLTVHGPTRMVGVEMAKQTEKFVTKWGGMPGQILFDRPYDDPACDVRFVGEHSSPEGVEHGRV